MAYDCTICICMGTIYGYPVYTRTLLPHCHWPLGAAEGAPFLRHAMSFAAAFVAIKCTKVGAPGAHTSPEASCTSGCTGHHLVEESYWKGGMKMPVPPKGPQPFCSGKVQESHHSPVPSRSSEKRWKKDEPGMQRKGKRDPLHWSKCQNKNTSIEVKWCRIQDSSSSKQDNCKTEVATPQIAILLQTMMISR